jgi:hypothetical protein
VPPLHDNIQDALALTQDGLPHTLALDTTGATFEGNESTFGEGWEGVWAKIDLSGYPVAIDGVNPNVEVTLDAVRTGGDANFHPYVNVYKVTDATFDPTSPDFSKLKDLNSRFIGDGTTDPPADTFLLCGGLNGANTSGGDFRSDNGVFYFFLTDWDFATYGAADVTVTIDAEPVCFDAIDIINPSSTTASVVDTNYVREAWDQWPNGNYPIDGQEPTLTFTWAGVAGQYTMSVTGKMSVNAANNGSIRVLARVNGRMFLGAGTLAPDDDSDFTFSAYDGLDGATWVTNDDEFTGTWIPLQPGDEIEILTVSDAQLSSSPFSLVPYDVRQVCFTRDTGAPTSSACTPSLAFPATPLGDVWGSPNGWGGQKFVLDEIWADQGITPYDEGDFAWGINWADFDIAALADGTVYIIVHDESSNLEWVGVKKYDPNTDDWTQVATLNVNTPPTAFREVGWGVSAKASEADGFVYFAFWEWDTFIPGVPDKTLFKWHCFALDTSDDSVTELGTGQNKYGITNQTRNYDLSVLAPEILAPGNGDVYVAAVETLDVSSPGNDRRMTVWRWNGTNWTDLNCPDPNDPDIVGGVYEVSGENGFYDRLSAMVAARSGEGLVTDGFTLVYTYFRAANEYPTETISYTVGTGWHDEIITDWVSIEGNDRLQWFTTAPDPNFLWSRLLIDHDLFWNETLGKLVLAGDLLQSFNSDDEIWDVWVMNDGGTQWELYNPDFPGKSAGPWRQSRNSSAMGPDGEIYRAMWSESISSLVNYEPKILKSSPGFSLGFAMAGVPAIMETATEDGANRTNRWVMYQFSTTNNPIKIVGDFAYTAWCADTQLDDGGSGQFADGIFVLKMPYVSCIQFVYGDIKRP